MSLRSKTGLGALGRQPIAFDQRALLGQIAQLDRQRQAVDLDRRGKEHRRPPRPPVLRTCCSRPCRRSYAGRSKASFNVVRRRSSIRLFAGIGAGLVEFEAALARRSGEILDPAQPPFGVAAPCRSRVEREIARRGLDRVPDPWAVEDQRRARAKQPRRAVEQAERRRPRADVNHVDAEHRIGAVDRPVGRRGIERSGGSNIRQRRRVTPGGDRSSASGWTSLGCHSRSRETLARNRRRARRCRWRSPAPGRVRGSHSRSTSAIGSRLRSAAGAERRGPARGRLVEARRRSSAAVARLPPAAAWRAGTSRAAVSVNMPSAKAISGSVQHRRADWLRLRRRRNCVRARSERRSSAIRKNIAAGEAFWFSAWVCGSTWMCIILPRCQPTPRADQQAGRRRDRHPAASAEARTNISDRRRRDRAPARSTRCRASAAASCSSDASAAP